MKTLLDALEAPISTLYEECGVAMLFIDAAGHVLRWNNVATAITGVQEEEAIGAYVWDVAARVAPAWIPHEIARSQVHRVITHLPAMRPGALFADRHTGHRRFHGTVLSVTGKTHALAVDLFPMRSGDQEIIACMLCRADQPITEIPRFFW